MAAIRRRHSKEELARRGDTIYERDIRPNLKTEDRHHFVAIDIETGAYEIDANEMAACERLRRRVPEAQVWLRKAGSRFARRFGGRGRLAE